MTETKSKTEPTSWLGHIHYKDAGGRDVIARGAVWCDSREGFDAALEAHLAEKGASFLWSEEVHNSINWFRKHGSNGLMAGLARKVDCMVPVALSDPKAAHDDTVDDESYLIIEEIEDVEPLDAQFGVWEKLTVPVALQGAMFGQPEATEAEIEQYGDNVPPMKTYAIIDSAKMPYLLTMMLDGSGLQYQSLFQGAAQEELKEHSPYLVELENSNDFVQKLFTGSKGINGLWEKELGIFIRSRANLAELRKHFRKFTRIKDDQGKWYYFRFWEGSAFVAYMHMFTAYRTENVPSIFKHKFDNVSTPIIRSVITQSRNVTHQIRCKDFTNADYERRVDMEILRYVSLRNNISNFIEKYNQAGLDIHENFGTGTKLELMMPYVINWYRQGFKSSYHLGSFVYWLLLLGESFENIDTEFSQEMNSERKNTEEKFTVIARGMKAKFGKKLRNYHG